MSSGNAKIGHHTPQFKATAVMPDGQFKDISLSDYKGKYVVFFFYPLDFTFVCPTEIIAFRDRAEEFKKLNCQVIGVSVDSHFCLLAWINIPKKQGGLGPMNTPLISDPKRTIAQEYGVLKAWPLLINAWYWFCKRSELEASVPLELKGRGGHKHKRWCS
uniref:Peroxiredoxin-1 n=1 Tax=Phocoena sinus TaxID=42100 RepID=A0A8C9C9V4_PHOSS